MASSTARSSRCPCPTARCSRRTTALGRARPSKCWRRSSPRPAKMTIDDIDIVEINEAFAAQVIPSARGIGVDPFSDKLNPHGGAIAHGHPFGMTGARILCTLLNGLRERDKTYGLETMCVGGGQGMAMILERLN